MGSIAKISLGCLKPPWGGEAEDKFQYRRTLNVTQLSDTSSIKLLDTDLDPRTQDTESRRFGPETCSFTGTVWNLNSTTRALYIFRISYKIKNTIQAEKWIETETYGLGSRDHKNTAIHKQLRHEKIELFYCTVCPADTKADC